MQRFLVALFVLATLSGCLTDAGNDSPALSELPSYEEDYRNGTRVAGIEQLGHWEVSGGQEADAWGDYLAVDRGSIIEIFEVDGKGEFELLSTITNTGSPVDVKWSDDGRFLIIVADDEASIEPLAGNAVFVGGFYVWNVEDKSAPSFVGYHEIGPRRGPHMVAFHTLASGDAVVLGANADTSIWSFDVETGDMELQARYEPDLVTDYNRDPEVFDVLYQGWAHDMFPLTNPDGTTTMFVANWDAGLRVVDITNPANPIEQGGWNAFPEGHEGNLHTVSTDWIGDRRITIGTVEVGFSVVGGYHYLMGTDRSILYVWDTTDPANIQLLGLWENPDKAPAGRDMVPGEEITSTHNIQFEEGRIYMAHYGLGVFVLDASSEEVWGEPRTLGVFHEPGMNVWDVVVSDGVLYSSGSSGIRALHFMSDTLGPKGIDSRA